MIVVNQNNKQMESDSKKKYLAVTSYWSPGMSIKDFLEIEEQFKDSDDWSYHFAIAYHKPKCSAALLSKTFFQIQNNKQNVKS